MITKVITADARRMSCFPYGSWQEEMTLLLLRPTIWKGGKLFVTQCRKAFHKIKVLKTTKVIIRMLIKEFLHCSCVTLAMSAPLVLCYRYFLVSLLWYTPPHNKEFPIFLSCDYWTCFHSNTKPQEGKKSIGCSSHFALISVSCKAMQTRINY